MLGSAARRLTIEAFLLTIAVSVSFWLFGVARTQAWLRQWRPLADSRGSVMVLIGEACAAQRRVKRATGIEGPCLVRSMILWTMLRRRGVAADLRVGFRKRAGKIEGHAWVEYAGTPINEEKDETLTFVQTPQPVSFDLWREPKRQCSDSAVLEQHASLTAETRLAGRYEMTRSWSKTRMLGIHCPASCVSFVRKVFAPALMAVAI